ARPDRPADTGHTPCLVAQSHKAAPTRAFVAQSHEAAPGLRASQAPPTTGLLWLRATRRPRHHERRRPHQTTTRPEPARCGPLRDRPWRERSALLRRSGRGSRAGIADASPLLPRCGRARAPESRALAASSTLRQGPARRNRDRSPLLPRCGRTRAPESRPRSSFRAAAGLAWARVATPGRSFHAAARARVGPASRPLGGAAARRPIDAPAARRRRDRAYGGDAAAST